MVLLQECQSNTKMMQSEVEEFWRLERVGVEESAFYLQKDMVTVGRKIKINHKPCNGPNVSRNHLKFVRSSSTLDCSSRQDWRKVTWSVRDLGTVAGSYLNGVKIVPRTSYSLNCGDIIGVGCPLSYSVKRKDFETFVYRIHAPEVEKKGLAPLDNRDFSSEIEKVILDSISEQESTQSADNIVQSEEKGEVMVKSPLVIEYLKKEEDIQDDKVEHLAEHSYRIGHNDDSDQSNHKGCCISEGSTHAGNNVQTNLCEMVEIKKEFEEDDEMPLIITNIESCQAYETKSKDEKKKEKKDKKRRQEKMRSDMQSSLKTSSISEKECSYENGNHSSCSLRASDLVDGLRILRRIGDYFCPGRLVDISPPDIYGIVVDKERGNKPHIFSQEEVLQEAVMEIKPTSVSELKVGDRVCVFWSSKMSYLHPGAVAGFDGDENFAIIQLDDGDSRDIHIDQIRYLPQNYPLIVPEQVSFTGLFGSRKRVSSTVMKKLKTEETV